MDPIIRLKAVNHYWNKRTQALFDITVDIFPGEIMIIRGPSGCGKTTLVTLAGALRSVQVGSARVLGEDLNGAPREALVRIRHKIGFIFQSHNLLPSLTSLQNVRMALDLDSKMAEAEKLSRSREMLEKVGLGERLNHYPEQLSGGQRQRVAIARALVHGPKIVLADEPTASLDSKAGRAVADTLKDLSKSQGCAVLMVTHDDRILSIADRIMTMKDGRIVNIEAAFAEAAGDILSAYSDYLNKGELSRFLGGLSDEDFGKQLRRISSEFVQLKSVLELGSQGRVDQFSGQLLAALTEKLVRMFSADRGSIFWVDSERQMLRSILLVNSGTERIEIPLSSGVAGRAAATGEALNVADAYSCPYFNPAPDRETGYRTRSILCVPVPGEDKRVCAVAMLLNKKGREAFSETDERSLKEFAEQMAPILQAVVAIQRQARDNLPPNLLQVGGG